MKLNEFINTGADEAILKSVPTESVSEELEKAMNRAGLVQVEKQVRGKNGVYTRKQWVKASDLKKETFSGGGNNSKGSDSGNSSGGSGGGSFSSEEKDKIKKIINESYGGEVKVTGFETGTVIKNGAKVPALMFTVDADDAPNPETSGTILKLGDKYEACSYCFDDGLDYDEVVSEPDEWSEFDNLKEAVEIACESWG